MWWGQTADLAREEPALVRVLVPAAGILLAVLLVLAGQVGFVTELVVFLSVTGLLAALVTWRDEEDTLPEVRVLPPRIGRRTRVEVAADPTDPADRLAS